MFQKRNKFVANNRRRYVHTKGRLAMVDIDARDICGSSESAVIGNNRCKRARGDAMIGATRSSSASGVISKRGVSLDLICNWHRVVQDGAVKQRLSSILSGSWRVGRRDVSDSNLGIERRDDAWAVLRLLSTVLITDGAFVCRAIIAEMAEQSAVIALVVTVFFVGNVRGVQLAVTQVRVLSGPFQVAA